MRVAKVRNSLETLSKIGIGVNSIIDVGIQHSTPVLMELFPNLHHYLFEPVEEYFPHIRQNYANLKYELVHAAVTDFDGKVSLKTEKKTRGDEISHSYVVEDETPETRSVPAIQLDSFFAKKQNAGPFFLKIDVEGPDVPGAILAGAQSVLQNTHAVMIEMTVDKFMERASLLHKAGFDIWDICDLCYYGDCLWQADVVFVRRELKNSNLDLRPMHRPPFQPELWQSGF